MGTALKIVEDFCCAHSAALLLLNIVTLIEYRLNPKNKPQRRGASVLGSVTTPFHTLRPRGSFVVLPRKDKQEKANV